MANLIKKFTALFTHQQVAYVNAARVNDIYKKIERGSNQIDLINRLKLDYIIVVRRGKDTGTIANIDINGDKFRSSVHNVFVKLDQLNRNKELAKRLKALPDINDVESDQEASEVTPDQSETINQNELIEMPIIELEEHEHFRDVNDQVINIEVRGERTKDKILFKAKDVASYFELSNLTETLLDDRKSYKYAIDYIILEESQPRYWQGQEIIKENNCRYYRQWVSQPCYYQGQEIIKENQCGDSPHWETQPTQCVDTKLLTQTDKKSRINHDNIFLTLAGYLRAAVVSRSGNANMAKVFDWIMTLVYTHQFGSDVERSELAQDLIKTILNDKLSGLYGIDLGSFSDLYDSMNICKETYPPSTYGAHRIYKFGLSKDISTRLNQHQNKKDGYGKWSNQVVLKWMILLSDSQLHEAESMLSDKFKAKGLTFEYTDESGKSHNELIIVGPKDEAKVKTIYKQTITYFPSKENELCKLMLEAQTKHEYAVLKLTHNHTKDLYEYIKVQHEYELKLSAANAATQLAQYETQLAQKDIQLAQKDTQIANTKIEALLLKLTLADLKDKAN